MLLVTVKLHFIQGTRLKLDCWRQHTLFRALIWTLWSTLQSICVSFSNMFFVSIKKPRILLRSKEKDNFYDRFGKGNRNIVKCSLWQTFEIYLCSLNPNIHSGERKQEIFKILNKQSKLDYLKYTVVIGIYTRRINSYNYCNPPR